LNCHGISQERFVQALYQLLLHRTGSPSEVGGWISNQPQEGRQGVALAILETSEFRTKLFEAYYNDLLHRPDDAAGLNDWVSSGLDAATVRQGFESGSEFFSNG
jgi:hypothetical protein